ncbi:MULTISPECIES: type VI secretion system ATPase TssH [unclassified Variovorax]|uniref:type VI secretion system ATPase TssH n=1 Tax=unclassified Variovorax TaxID=663243 RepID=UPI0008B4D440|nr:MULTISPECIES: type VI secretion system ATPase TssH [unclassified Variovorax]SEJ80769.1 type VI secretion system protein VasG [Variovorax sp. OK202]SFC94153.1 type VI secretion system protein VasG [Variovorax sp. OK212]
MTIARRALFGKLNLTLFRGIESATAFARLRGNPHVELTHWIHQLWQLNDSDLHRICRHYKIDAQAVERDMAYALSALPAGATSLSDFSHHIETAIERAWVLASLEFGDRCIRGAWLIAALLQTPELRRTLLGISAAFQRIPVDGLVEAATGIVAGSLEDGEGPHDGSGLPFAVPGEASGALPGSPDGKSALARYCTDLTERARAGQVDPVIGRVHEIRTMVDILLRRRQNNPLLTGEAGVGKTAVVEGLALAIAGGEVPPALRDARLLSLDVGTLLAGASMRGEFESRLKSLLDEAGKSVQPVILFIDEVHTLIGAGGQAGTGDAANLLKPALARGTLRTVGATTWSEYKRHIEKDPALTRRFQTLQVAEPEEAAAIEMVRGLVATFAAHHGVTVLDEAVRAAVTLSHRYIPARQLPDKAISLLDTACARVAMSLHTPPAVVERLRAQIAALRIELDLLARERLVAQGSEARSSVVDAAKAKLSAAVDELVLQEARWHDELASVQEIHALRRGEGGREEEAGCAGSKPLPAQLIALEHELLSRQQDASLVFAQVDESVVAAIVADWTGIPVGRMVKDEVAAVFGLQGRLDQRVIGQGHALAAIAERVQIARTRLSDPNKPVGVFLLAGPSGVGKTETALALAEAMYGGEQNLITINMSEFQEPHTVSTLKGSPPGYVGFGEGGVLTEAVRRRPYSVILLDEVEKAHPDVHEIFYQVFDKGWMEDGEGRHIDFRNTTILLTSNTGAERIASLCEGVSPLPGVELLRDELQPILRTVFPAAFLGRLSVVPYLPLGAEALGDIVSLHLERVVDRMNEQHGIELVYTPAVVHEVIERCGTHETGARRLIGFIEQKLLPLLSREWLDALHRRRTIVRMSVDIEARHGPGHDLQGGGAIVCHTEYA